MVKVHLVVMGRVQGVLYRANTKKKAEELLLCGYAKNLPDGSVEVIAQGPKTKVDELVEYCMHGHDCAYVEDIDIEYSDNEEDIDKFEIK
ncbi:MAG: acylphosphatase [Nanoarchaeota archaeon]|nr:acylphosphatase [Nanoarchaeota archaeon]